MHEVTKPLLLANDRLFNEAVHCACSKHKLSRIFFICPRHLASTMQVMQLSLGPHRRQNEEESLHL